MVVSDKTRWAVIGAGNGGQSLAGHLAVLGFAVRIYDIFPETIDAILNQGGIIVDGAVQGFGRLELATTDIAEALHGIDIVMVVAPAVAHADIAKACAPHLSDGQIVFVHPGATGGALEFKRSLSECDCSAEVILAEANSLLYACRSSHPGKATIFAVKHELKVAALPATENERVVTILNRAFPQMVPAKNVLETSLGNPNAMMHPAPSLLNTGLIESDRPWRYYLDGITPAIGAFVEAIDRERLAIGRAFQLDLENICQWYRSAYGIEGSNVSEIVRNNPAYAEVLGQKTLRTRYLLEDIPMGLVPMRNLAQLAGVDTPRMHLVIRLGEYLLKEDFYGSGRIAERMGLSGMNIDEIIRFVEKGG